MECAKLYVAHALVCPKCFWRPAVRFSERLVQIARTLEPDEILQTLKCERKTCRGRLEGGRPVIVEVQAFHLQRAVLDEGARC